MEPKLMLPPDEEAAADEEPAEEAEEGAVVGLELLLHAARAPGTAASPAAVASPLIAERREKAPDLAGLAGVSVMATPCGNGSGIQTIAGLNKMWSLSSIRSHKSVKICGRLHGRIVMKVRVATPPA